MSAVKNFGLFGVGSDVQFGKGGNRIVNSGGALLLVNASGAPIRLGVADGTASGDAASYGQLTGAVSTLNANVAAVQANVTALTTSTTANAVALQASIANSSVQISQLQSNVANNTSAISALQAQTTTIGNGSTTLQTNIVNSAGLNADGTLLAFTGTNYLASATTLRAGEVALDTALKSLSTTQQTNATALAGSISQNANAITAETSRAQAAETTINSAISAETIRAQNAESVLTNSVTTLSNRITGLGNVFNYKGQIDGSKPSLDTVDGTPAVGDYYKVTSAGTYTYTDSSQVARSITVNTNDGLVKSATGWDKIDNTDSTVQGTANLIAVTGSTDAGYTVTIDTNFVSRVSTLETNATAQQGLITALQGNTASLGGSIVALQGADAAQVANISLNANAITAETTRATGAEGTLTTNLGLVRTSAGLAANGSYVANGTAHYVAGATTLVDADNKLDAALYAVQQTIASLSQTSIKSANTLSQVQATNTDIEFFGSVGGSSTLFLTAATGSSQNATLTLSTATAGEVRIEAHSGSIANVDVHLVPLGTGAVNVSSARLTNVANGVGATDGAAYGQVTAAQATANASITAAQVGAIRTVTGTLASSSATANLGSPIKGRVLRVTVQVSAAYAAGSQITVGDTGNASSLAAATDIDEGTVGLYVVGGFTNYATATQLTATVSSGGATGGATVIVEYIQA